MGERKRQLTRSKAFLRRHPTCCYCGKSATTVDEMPPKSMFYKRIWPEGFQFPACAPCNNGRRLVDAVVAFHVKAGELRDKYLDLDAFNKIARALRRHPDLLPTPADSVYEQKELWRSSGFSSASKLMLPRIPAATSSERVGRCIEIFLVRLLQALHYKELSAIVPNDHLATVAWRTNATFLQPGSYNDIVQTAIATLPVGQPTMRGKATLTEQFQYRWGNHFDAKVFSYFAQFGTAFVAMGFSAPEPFYYRSKLSPSHRLDGTAFD